MGLLHVTFRQGRHKRERLRKPLRNPVESTIGGKETASHRLLGAMSSPSLSNFTANPPFTPVPDALRPGYGQPFAMQINAHQREAGAQPVVHLLLPTGS